MFSCPRFLPALGLLAALLLTACGGADAAKNARPRTVDDRFPIKVGDRVVQMQIAAQVEEMQKGLMFRQSMGADEGMLFRIRVIEVFAFGVRTSIAGRVEGLWTSAPALDFTVGHCRSSGGSGLLCLRSAVCAVVRRAWAERFSAAVDGRPGRSGADQC